ncbi:MAG: histidine kinase, partial [Campylobacteraceae bacterium]|nr:histidine kinase [Campylobacteraceae bacterium]
VYKDLDKVNDTVEYLSLIIDNFSNFFNPNNELEEFYLKDMIDENIEILQSSFKENEVYFIMNIENTKLKAYKFELLQVLINIINNAKDALVDKDIENKLIFINSYVKENNIYIEIVDNALGIPFNLSSKIYEPYFSTKDKLQGAGIGLYMSLSIIKKHFKGSLINGRFEFTYKNKTYVGEKFIISFPLILEKS